MGEGHSLHGGCEVTGESVGEGRSPHRVCEVTEESLGVRDVLHVEGVR